MTDNISESLIDENKTIKILVFKAVTRGFVLQFYFP